MEDIEMLINLPSDTLLNKIQPKVSVSTLDILITQHAAWRKTRKLSRYTGLQSHKATDTGGFHLEHIAAMSSQGRREITLAEMILMKAVKALCGLLSAQSWNQQLVSQTFIWNRKILYS